MSIFLILDQLASLIQQQHYYDKAKAENSNKAASRSIIMDGKVSYNTYYTSMTVSSTGL